MLTRFSVDAPHPQCQKTSGDKVSGKGSKEKGLNQAAKTEYAVAFTSAREDDQCD